MASSNRDECSVDVEDLGPREVAGLSYVKVDVEGDDLAVLRGGETIIRQAQPTISIAVWDGGHEIREWFHQRGYSIFVYDPDHHDLWAVPLNYKKQANLLAIPTARIDPVRERLGAGPIDRPPKT